LIDSELGVESSTVHSHVKTLNITPDDEIMEAMQLDTAEVLETPKKKIEEGTTRDCNTSYTLGSAMKELDIEMKTEMFLPKENLLVK
jgi:hypothetical protein